MYVGSDNATCDQSKASLFNNYFYSGSPRLEINESTIEDSSDTSLSDISITPADVYEALSSLDPNKAI